MRITIICQDFFFCAPWMVGIRRALSIDVCPGFLRVKKHLPPAYFPGSEDILGRGGEVLTGGTSLFLAAAHTFSIGSPAERVATESLAGSSQVRLRA